MLRAVSHPVGISFGSANCVVGMMDPDYRRVLVHRDPKTGQLVGDALTGFWEECAPILFFANACSSARTAEDASRQFSRSDAAMGLGQAFLSAGVGCYIGTIWEAPDNEATLLFARAVYEEFLEGCSVGQALLTARNRCVRVHGEEELTWARYALFGDPFTHIPVFQGQSKYYSSE